MRVGNGNVFEIHRDKPVSVTVGAKHWLTYRLVFDECRLVTLLPTVGHFSLKNHLFCSSRHAVLLGGNQQICVGTLCFSTFSPSYSLTHLSSAMGVYGNPYRHLVKCFDIWHTYWDSPLNLFTKCHVSASSALPPISYWTSFKRLKTFQRPQIFPIFHQTWYRWGLNKVFLIFQSFRPSANWLQRFQTGSEPNSHLSQFILNVCECLQSCPWFLNNISVIGNWKLKMLWNLLCGIYMRHRYPRSVAEEPVFIECCHNIWVRIHQLLDLSWADHTEWQVLNCITSRYEYN